MEQSEACRSERRRRSGGVARREGTRAKGMAWGTLLGLMLTGAAFSGGLVSPTEDGRAELAAGDAPAAALHLIAEDSEADAYFFCARQVAREMDGSYSVETFPGPSDGETTPLGDGRYRVESFVDETREDGSRVRYSFVCAVSFDRDRWTLDDLDLSQRPVTVAALGRP